MKVRLFCGQLAGRYQCKDNAKLKLFLWHNFFLNTISHNISFKNSFKWFLLVFILFILSINVFQDGIKINFFQKPLRGNFELKQKETFDWKKWFDGTYAEKTNGYLNDHFGFHNFYVRFNGQTRFLLFKNSNAPEFIVGKENYLYQIGYIKEYNGDYYIGEKAINDTVLKLKELQTELKKIGKNFLVVIAPSKARIYPEYIPDYLKKGPTENCNYAVYTKALKKQGVNFIDFDNWYLQKKVKSKYLLIPQLGIHWSRLEAVLAMDTIVKYLSVLSGMQFPQIKINKLIEKDTLEDSDDDAANVMNLMFLPAFKKMAYPQFEIIEKERATQNLFVISDSFWWDIYSRQLPETIFKNNEFWYYYNWGAWGNNYMGKKETKDLDLKRCLLQYNDIVIVCAEANLDKIGFGFISGALQALKKEIKPTPDEIRTYESDIRNNPEWMKQVILKAKKNNLPADSMIYLDAAWMVTANGPKFKEPSVEDAIKQIKDNPEWFNQIKNKAEKTGENLDSAIKNNAIYVIEERKRNKK